MDPKWILLGALVVIAVTYLWFWISSIPKYRAAQADPTAPIAPTFVQMVIGFVTNFFDTLGIGSFATTTSMYKLLGVCRDEKIPGTLNIGHTGSTFVQALIYITIVEVEFTTLITIIFAAVLGAWMGGGIVASLPRRQIQVGMGIALIGAACLMLASLSGIGPAPGVALGLDPQKLAIAFFCSMVLGALMMLGIGYYAPCLIMISLLGMNPTAAFPIMMGACAFLMPVGSLQFIRKNAYDLRAALGLAIGGPGAVVIAAFIVRSLPLDAVRWLVVGVVLYTATSMLRTAMVEKQMALAAQAKS